MNSETLKIQDNIFTLFKYQYLYKHKQFKRRKATIPTSKYDPRQNPDFTVKWTHFHKRQAQESSTFTNKSGIRIHFIAPNQPNFTITDKQTSISLYQPFNPNPEKKSKHQIANKTLKFQPYEQKETCY